MRSPSSVSSLKLTMKASGAQTLLSTPSILGTCTFTGHSDSPSAGSGPNLLFYISDYKQRWGGSGFWGAAAEVSGQSQSWEVRVLPSAAPSGSPHQTQLIESCAPPVTGAATSQIALI